MKDHNEKHEKELELLKKSCKENPKDFDLIQELLTLQKNKSLLNKKRGHCTSIRIMYIFMYTFHMYQHYVHIHVYVKYVSGLCWGSAGHSA